MAVVTIVGVVMPLITVGQIVRGIIAIAMMVAYIVITDADIGRCGRLV